MLTNHEIMTDASFCSISPLPCLITNQAKYSLLAAKGTYYQYFDDSLMWALSDPDQALYLFS